MSFVTSKVVISLNKHGFVPGRPTSTNLLTGLDHWTTDLDSRKLVAILYIDSSKAFGRVPGRRLLDKLEYFGIRGILLSWITAYVNGRTFSVQVDFPFSDKLDVHSGVSQGSVLGPF